MHTTALFSGVIADGSFTLREYEISRYFAAVTLTWLDDLHIVTWPVSSQDLLSGIVLLCVSVIAEYNAAQ